MPLAIVHCNQNEAGHQTIQAPSMPCWGATGPWKHSLAFMPQDGSNRQINRWNLYQWEVFSTRTKWMESFFIPLSNFTVFQHRICTDSSSVAIRSSQVVFKINQVKNLTAVTWLLNRSLRVLSKQLSIKIVKYEDGMLILGQNDVFCGHNVVNFSLWFLQLTVFKYLVASHVIEPGSLLTEPGAVIMFSHFSSHPGICML